MGPFVTGSKKLKRLVGLDARWVRQGLVHTAQRRVILDMDNSESRSRKRIELQDNPKLQEGHATGDLHCASVRPGEAGVLHIG